MADNEVHGIYQSITRLTGDLGELRGGFSTLRDQVHTLMTVWQEQDDSASEGRRRLYNKMDEVINTVNVKLDDMQAAISEIDVKVTPVIEKVDKEIAPAIKDYTTIRNKFTGAWMVISIVAAAALVALGFLFQQLWAAVKPHITFG